MVISIMLQVLLTELIFVLYLEYSFTIYLSIQLQILMGTLHVSHQMLLAIYF